MKLPDLPLSGQSRALRTGDVERARRREQDVATALRGVGQIGSQLSQMAVRMAENEARLQATNEVTAMQERVNTGRRDLANLYLSDEAPPVEQFLEDDIALVRNASEETRKRLSPRARRYADEALAGAQGPAYQASRFKTFSELAANRQRLHLVEVTERAQRQIREDPNMAGQYMANGSALFEDLYYENDQQRDSLEREFMTTIVGTAIESYNANGRPDETLALLNNAQFSKYIKNPEQVRVQATDLTLKLLGQEIDYAIDAVALDPDRGDALRENAPLTVGITENIVGFDQDQAVRGLRNRVANVQLLAYINRDRAEEGLARLNNGEFNRDLSAEEIGDWLGKFNTAIAHGVETRMALDLHRADRLIDGIKNGDKAASAAAPAVLQELLDSATNPAATESQRIAIREKLFEVETYAENVHLFGPELTQMSLAELDATIASAESLLITSKGESFETSAMRTKMVEDVKARGEGLKREFRADPAAYLIKYDPEIGENFRKLDNALRNMNDPAQLELLPQYMQRHMGYMEGEQTAQWGVADADVAYFPENMPIGKNIVSTLDGLDLNAKAARVSWLALAVPPQALPSFLKNIRAEDPGVAAAVGFAANGLLVNAEDQLRGSQRRKAVNANAAKVTKDAEVMTRLRAMGGVPYDALPPGSGEVYSETLLNQYYALAPAEELNTGVATEKTVRQAIEATWGETVGIPQSELPNNRMISYRRADSKVMMKPSQVQGQLSAIRDSRIELTKTPYTAYGGVVSQADLITKGRFVPVGNGKYQVTLPEATMMGAQVTDGFVMDGDNQPYILDLNEYPVGIAPVISPDFGKSL